MLYISAPFGNYINAKNATSVLGTFTVHPRPGRITQILKTLRYSFKDSCWYNSLGLRNPGIDSILKKYPRTRNQVISIAAIEEKDWRLLWQKIPSNIPLELNISCPNVTHFNDYTQDLPHFVERDPIVKLSPTMSETEIKYLYDMGFRSYHSCNTLKTIRGARSGEILKQFAKTQIKFLKKLDHENYVIAGGGISNFKDIYEYHQCGADGFSLGSVCFNPFKLRKIIHDKTRINSIPNEAVKFLDSNESNV
jgi:dihydroorotate dehydrogenase